MDLIFAISSHRRISEQEVVNSYTYRQAMSLIGYIIQDKFAVVSEVIKSFGSNKGSRSKKPYSSSPPPSSVGGRLPSWYQTRPNARIRVVDLDGPMESLTPYLGKAKLARGRKGNRR